MTKNRWAEFSARVHERADMVTEATAAAIVTAAALKAPYRFGLLRASIEQEGAGGARRRITVGQFYGIYQELGTRYISARPYLEPAVEQNRAGYLEAIAGVLGGW